MAEQYKNPLEPLEKLAAIKRDAETMIKSSILSHISEIPRGPQYVPERGFIVVRAILGHSEHSQIVKGIADALEAIGFKLCDAHNCSYYVDVVDVTDAYFVYLYVDF